MIDQLSAPFDPAIVSWRVGPTTKDKSKGMALAYIDARDVMRRLDDVCGPENWQDEYPWSDGKRVVCRIGIKIGEEWVWKTDGAGDTDTEGEKGALSDAFKRAAVKWGIGRYLYDVDTPWVQIEQRGNSYVIPDGERTRLVGLLRRTNGHAPAPPTQAHAIAGAMQEAAKRGTRPATQNADPPLSEKAAAFVANMRAGIDEAQEPRVIEELLSINSTLLGSLKTRYAPHYDALMRLASARTTELLGGTG